MITYPWSSVGQEPGRRLLIPPRRCTTATPTNTSSTSHHTRSSWRTRPGVAALDRPVDDVEDPGEHVLLPACGLSHVAHWAGLSVRALIGADEGRRRDGQRELPVHLAGDAAQERRREEHGHQHSVIAMTGPVTSFIAWMVASRGAIPCSMWWRGVLDDHDGVVHHDADGQDQPEQREQVDREARATA